MHSVTVYYCTVLWRHCGSIISRKIRPRAEWLFRKRVYYLQFYFDYFIYYF